MKFEIDNLKWTREPQSYCILEDRIEIVTKPHTDLWQRTYYHFRNDNAPVLQMETDEKYFSFIVKTEFESKHRFDQCGVVMYLDSENWLKGSIEYENEEFQHLGSVVTNNGYSDWATTAITFEYEVPSVEEFAGRIEHILKKYPYLVAEKDGRIVGYAYAGTFYDRAAYDWAVENSVKFHEHMGYRIVGKFCKCGYKFGKWYNMVWMEKHIGEHVEHAIKVRNFQKV